jgi:hypothetical protein
VRSTVGREDAIRDLGWLGPHPLGAWSLHTRRRSSEKKDTDRQEPSKATYAPPAVSRQGRTHKGPAQAHHHGPMARRREGHEVEGVVPNLPRALPALANEAGVALGWPHPSPEGVPSREGLSQGRAHRPCHYRAIHTGNDRSRADNHGQHHSGHYLRRSPFPVVTITLDLALGTGSRRSPPGHGKGLRATKINRLPRTVITTNGLWTFLDWSWELASLSRIDGRRDRSKGDP